MNIRESNIYSIIRIAFLLSIQILLSCPCLLAQEPSFIEDARKITPDKYSIGIESGMNFNSFTFNKERTDSTATGRSAYMAINGSYAVSDQLGVQLSCSYEEVKWSTSQDRWDLPTSTAVRDAFGLPDSAGSLTSLKQSVAVTMPRAGISAHIRYNPTSWLGLMVGGTVQFRTGNGRVERTWQAVDSTGKIPFRQSAILPVTENLPSRRYALDGEIAITPLRMKQVDLSIHGGYRIFLAEDYPKQSVSNSGSLRPTENVGKTLRTVAPATLTSAMRIGLSLSYRF